MQTKWYCAAAVTTEHIIPHHCVVIALQTWDPLHILCVYSIRTEWNGLIPKIQPPREGEKTQEIERAGSYPDPCLRCSQYFTCICLITSMQECIKNMQCGRCSLCSRSSAVKKYYQTSHTDAHISCIIKLYFTSRAQRRCLLYSGKMHSKWLNANLILLF